MFPACWSSRLPTDPHGSIDLRKFVVIVAVPQGEGRAFRHRAPRGIGGGLKYRWTSANDSGTECTRRPPQIIEEAPSARDGEFRAASKHVTNER